MSTKYLIITIYDRKGSHIGFWKQNKVEKKKRTNLTIPPIVKSLSIKTNTIEAWSRWRQHQKNTCIFCICFLVDLFLRVWAKILLFFFLHRFTSIHPFHRYLWMARLEFKLRTIYTCRAIINTHSPSPSFSLLYLILRLRHWYYPFEPSFQQTSDDKQNNRKQQQQRTKKKKKNV